MEVLKSKKPITNFLCACALIVVSFVVYSNSLHGDFLIDDQRGIVDNQKIHNVNEYLSKHLHFTEIGFLDGLNTALCWHFFGDNPFGYHLLSVIAHTICVLLLFCLSRLLFKNSALAFLASLIFAVHPIHTEAVSWISGRFYVLQTIFYLSSFICYVKARYSMSWFMLSLGFLVVCLMFGSNVVSLPVMFLAYELLFPDRSPRDPRYRKLRIFAVSLVLLIGFAVSAMYFVQRFKYSRTIYNFRGWSYLIVAAKAFLYYLKILYLPLQRGIFHSFAYVNPNLNKLSPLFYFSLVVIAGMMTSLFALRKKLMAVSFGIMWFLVAYLPFSNIIPICNIISERYLYLPSIGYSIVMAALFLKVWELINRETPYRAAARKVLVVVIVTFLSSYSFLTMSHNIDYNDAYTFWASNLEDFPDGYRACNNLAGTFYTMGDLNNAAAYSYINLMIKPDQPHVWINLGTIYEQRRETDKAIECYQNALKIDTNNYAARMRLKKILPVSNEGH